METRSLLATVALLAACAHTQDRSSFVDLRNERDARYVELVRLGDQLFDQRWEAGDFELLDARPEEDFPKCLGEHRPGEPFVSWYWDDVDQECFRAAVLPIEEHRELTGTYACGDGLGFNLVVTLKPDGSYEWRHIGCLGVYGEGTGRWSLRGNEVVFTPGFDEALDALEWYPCPRGPAI